MTDPSELTPEQKKAFNALKRAVKKCQDANVYFYQVLSTTHAMNGNVVVSVEEGRGIEAPGGMINTDELYMDSVSITDSWADDTHYVVLKESGDE